MDEWSHPQITIIIIDAIVTPDLFSVNDVNKSDPCSFVIYYTLYSHSLGVDWMRFRGQPITKIKAAYPTYINIEYFYPHVWWDGYLWSQPTTNILLILDIFLLTT